MNNTDEIIKTNARNFLRLSAETRTNGVQNLQKTLNVCIELGPFDYLPPNIDIEYFLNILVDYTNAVEEDDIQKAVEILIKPNIPEIISIILNFTLYRLGVYLAVKQNSRDYSIEGLRYSFDKIRTIIDTATEQYNNSINNR